MNRKVVEGDGDARLCRCRLLARDSDTEEPDHGDDRTTHIQQLMRAACLVTDGTLETRKDAKQQTTTYGYDGYQRLSGVSHGRIWDRRARMAGSDTRDVAIGVIPTYSALKFLPLGHESGMLVAESQSNGCRWSKFLESIEE